jgi:hypothetical protein
MGRNWREPHIIYGEKSELIEAVPLKMLKEA